MCAARKLDDEGLLEFLAGTSLFEGTSQGEIAAMAGCLGAKVRSYESGAYIFHMGQRIRSMGLVLSGAVRLESVNVWGDVSVVGIAQAGEVFAEAYAAAPNEALLVDVVAAQDCEVLFLNVGKVLTTCSHACRHHSRVSGNLTSIFAKRNIMLSRRIFHAAPKSIRGKVLAYLSDEAMRAHSAQFDIPFNRQQLADYLGVDRSALSAELSRMQRDGLLRTKRSRFVLLHMDGA